MRLSRRVKLMLLMRIPAPVKRRMTMSRTLTPLVPTARPSAAAPAEVPSRMTSGPFGFALLLKMVCVPPSRTLLAAVIAGSGDVGWITGGHGAGMLKTTVQVDAQAFASVMACRSEPAPLSLVFVTSSGAVIGAAGKENSEVPSFTVVQPALL